MQSYDCLVVGTGPAGLMAADIVSAEGHSVLIIDAKPSFGRKFLMAGKSGLNITKDEPRDTFISSYIDPPEKLRNALAEFGPEDAKAFAEGLDQKLFTGSSKRVFPDVMKASPMLRNWLGRLQKQSVDSLTHAKWLQSDGTTHLVRHSDKNIQIEARTVVFAMGGGSWARLGSDGAWTSAFQELGIQIDPFAPSNVSLRIDWSKHMQPFLGKPLKNIVFMASGTKLSGEAVITAKGLEGTAIYNATPSLRKGARLLVDLLPQKSVARIETELAALHRKMSLSNRLRKIGLADTPRALLMEFARPLPDGNGLARKIKSLEIAFQALGDLDEAISTAGGVRMDQLDDHFMLKARRGYFCAGEMLDWDAPTGGYLITACLATGRKVGMGVNAFLA